MGKCEVPPEGWHCTRDGGHDGPCAAYPVGFDETNIDILFRLGTFNTDECISYEDLKHLFTTKQCTQSCTNCNLMKNDTKGEAN